MLPRTWVPPVWPGSLDRVYMCKLVMKRLSIFLPEKRKIKFQMQEVADSRGRQSDKKTIIYQTT